MSQWTEVPGERKEQLPPEFKNHAFRHLFEKVLNAGGEIISRFECVRPTASAILVDVYNLSNAPGARREGSLDLEKIEERQQLTTAKVSPVALIISTTDTGEIEALLKGELPASLVGVQNTPGCKQAFEQAMRGQELCLKR
jgi:flagellar motor component MotA